MAYVQTTPVVTRTRVGGRKIVRITFVETGATSTSEWSVSDGMIPSIGTVKLYKADLTAGTGTTIQPKMGRATAPTVDTQDWIGQISPAAGAINDAAPLYYAGLTGTIYGRSTPNNAAGDHTIYTEIEIVEGHI